MKHQLSIFGAAAVWLGGACLFATGCGPTNLSGPTGVVVVSAGPHVSRPAASVPAGETPIAPAVEPVAQPAEAAAQTVTDAPKPPVKQRLPADRQPRRQGDAEKITFEDLNLGMQADVAFRPFMITDRVKALEGQRVSIIGYIHAGQTSPASIKKFVLLKNTQCKFGPGGQADHLGMIYLKEGTTIKFTDQPVKVEGRLEIVPNDVDGITWSIYDLKDATAEVVKVAK